jgi:hypothetical protein
MGQDQGARIGVLISLEESTGPMRQAAAGVGFYESPWNPKKPHPKVQLLTIKDLLAGAQVNMPPPGQVNITFQRAVRVKGDATGPGQLSLPEPQ